MVYDEYEVINARQNRTHCCSWFVLFFLIGLKILGRRREVMKNKKRKRKIENSQIYVQEIDYDKLAESIVKASERLDEKKKNQQEQEDTLQGRQWKKILNQKDYPPNENWLKRRLHKFRNEIMLYKELMFFKEKNTKEAITTFALINLVTQAICTCIKIFLYLLTLIFICKFVIEPKTNFVLFILAIFIWTLARLTRIAIFEISKLEDNNLLLNIFSGSVSFIALIVAIIAIRVQ